MGTVNVGTAAASTTADGSYGVYIDAINGTVNTGEADTVSSVGIANIGPQETAQVTLVKVSSARLPKSAMSLPRRGIRHRRDPGRLRRRRRRTGLVFGQRTHHAVCGRSVESRDYGALQRL